MQADPSRSEGRSHSGRVSGEARHGVNPTVVLIDGRANITPPAMAEEKNVCWGILREFNEYSRAHYPVGSILIIPALGPGLVKRNDGIGSVSTWTLTEWHGKLSS